MACSNEPWCGVGLVVQDHFLSMLSGEDSFFGTCFALPIELVFRFLASELVRRQK